MLADSSFIYFLLHFYAMMFGEDLFMYILQNLFEILKFQIFIWFWRISKSPFSIASAQIDCFSM